MNAFELLGLSAGLLISDAEIREAFREKAALAHPDSGGSEADFAELQRAREMLLSPAKRIKEWLSAKGEHHEARGQIEPGLMDLFQKVAEVGADAEAAVKAMENARSALAKGMAEIAAMDVRESVASLLEEIAVGIRQRVSGFSDIEKSDQFLAAAKSMRDLVFLEKWQGSLKGVYSRLL